MRDGMRETKRAWTVQITVGRPVLRVDRRDMPGLSADGGRENFKKAG